MKNRLNLLDVLAEVRDLQALLVGSRLQNVYDMESKTFLLKFNELPAAATATNTTGKAFLLVESGVRLHTTRYGRDKPTAPGQFTMKLRKHLKNKRCTAISLMGLDRVVDLTFGSGEATYHLIIELFDRGNVVLTDHEHTILSLLRTYTLQVPGTMGGAGAGGDKGDDEEGGKDGKKKGGAKEGKGGKTKGTSKEKEAAAAAQAAAQQDKIRIGVKKAYTFATEEAGKPLGNTRAAILDAVFAKVQAERGESSAATSGAAAGEEAAPSASSSLMPPLVDVTQSPELASLQLAAFVDWYFAVKWPALNGKQRKKSTIGLALASRGSGADVFGTTLLDHALVRAGVGADALITTLQAKPADKLLAIARELCALPDTIAGVLSRPLSKAYAYVEPKTAEAGSKPAATGAGEAVDSSSAAAAALSGPCLGEWDFAKGKLASAADSAAPASLSRAPSSEPASTATATAPTEGAAATEGSAPAAAAAAADDYDAGNGDTADLSSQRPLDLPFTFLDFAPIMIAQYDHNEEAADEGDEKQQSFVVFPSFDSLTDEYFSRLDLLKAEKNEAAARSAAAKKLQRLREGHTEAISTLESLRESNYQKGRVIQSHSAAVNAACTVVRSALEHGVDWLELEKLVQTEQANGNPIAKLIVAMDLPKASVTLALQDEEMARDAAIKKKMARAGRSGENRGVGDDDEDDDDDDDDDDSDEDGEGDGEEEAAAGAGAGGPKSLLVASKGKGKVKPDTKLKQQKGKGGGKGGAGAPKKDPFSVEVSVDVFETADANSRRYFEAGKAARSRAERTEQAATSILKKAEKQAEASLAKQINAASAARAIRLPRSPAWYEKYLWFLSQEGVVVVAGRNAQDNEQLVKRYLRPQDCYVHADAHGAATVIVRNPDRDPKAGKVWSSGKYQLSLEGAGAFCICLSSCWTAHITTGAWWVQADQVSKTAPTGEYLGTGSFMIRGKKTFLPPVKLELGLALLWKVDPSCVPAHRGDRYARGEGGTAAADEDDKGAGEPTPAAGAGSAADKKEGDAGEKKAGKPSAGATKATPDAVSPAGKGGKAVQKPEKKEKGPAAKKEEPTTEPVAEAAAAAVDDEKEDGDAADKDGESAAGGAGGKTSGGGKPVPAHVRRLAKKLQAKEKGLDSVTALKRALEHVEAAAKKAEDELNSDDDKEGEGGSDGESESDGDDEGAAGLSALPAAGASLKRAVSTTSTATGATKQSQQQQPKRGAKGKTKKMKAKYADQDDEDRRAAMLALGHKNIDGEPEPEPAPAAAASAAPAAGAGGSSKGGAPSGDFPKGPRPPRGPKKPSGNDEDEEGDAKAAAAAAADNDEEGDKLAALVAVPAPGDIITHVIPMLCPYPVALTCKYRLKLVPGALKKGKAAQSAIHLFEQQAGVASGGSKGGSGLTGGTAREQELIKALVENDVINAVVGSCKVAPAAGVPPGFTSSGGGAAGAKTGAGGRAKAGAAAEEEK